MHEASIAISLLETVSEQCLKLGYSSIESVRLKVGKAAGILPDSLLFAFDIAKTGTIANEAELIIDFILLGGHCLDCNASFESEERYIFACPVCDSRSIKITQGDEMQIVDMEVD
jgi:hydrogenase nickel incorporation protein HypA/HybF